jgi:hypothetical protein
MTAKLVRAHPANARVWRGELHEPANIIKQPIAYMKHQPVALTATYNQEPPTCGTLERWLNRLVVLCCAFVLIQSSPAAAKCIARCLGSTWAL